MMTVLIVDDEPTLLKNVAHSLRGDGFSVETAMTGRAARSTLRAGAVNAMCLDVHLPDCDGLDLMEEARRINPNIAIVVISGAARQEDRDRAARLGAREFLSKPFRLSVLKDLLRSSSKQGAGLANVTFPDPASPPDAAAPKIFTATPRKGGGASAATATALTPERLARAKSAYSCRRVPLQTATMLINGDVAPRAGDLVLARVNALGQHRRIELGNGRRAGLYVNDEIVVSYGNRYAPDQFEALVPTDLRACHLVAAGGIAATSLSKHHRMANATQIVPRGLLANADGRVLNLAEWRLPQMTPSGGRPFTTAVVGTAMNAGKTTTVANLVHGMIRSGMKVGAAKVTGTGAGGDLWMMTDAGATRVLDFTDTGVPSTHKLPIAEIEDILSTLIGHLCKSAVDAIVIEIADGLLHEETAGLLVSSTFSKHVDEIIFAASDAMGAVAGLDWLRKHSLPVVAIAGAVTSSPLAVRETEALVDVPVLDLPTLRSGVWRPGAGTDAAVAARVGDHASITPDVKPVPGECVRVVAPKGVNR